MHYKLRFLHIYDICIFSMGLTRIPLLLHVTICVYIDDESTLLLVLLVTDCIDIDDHDRIQL